MTTDPIEAALEAQKHAFHKALLSEDNCRDAALVALRAAIAAYLRAEAVRRPATEGGGWCEVLAAEVERQGGAK